MLNVTDSPQTEVEGSGTITANTVHKIQVNTTSASINVANGENVVIQQINTEDITRAGQIFLPKSMSNNIPGCLDHIHVFVKTLIHVCN